MRHALSYDWLYCIATCRLWLLSIAFLGQLFVEFIGTCLANWLPVTNFGILSAPPLMHAPAHAGCLQAAHVSLGAHGQARHDLASYCSTNIMEVTNNTNSNEPPMQRMQLK